MYDQPESSQQRGDRLLAEYQDQRAGIEPVTGRPLTTLEYALQLICVGPKALIADMALVATMLFGAAALTAAVAALTAPHHDVPPASGAFSVSMEATSRPAAASPLGGGATREAR